MIELKITFERHFRNLASSIITLLVALLLTCLFYYGDMPILIYLPILVLPLSIIPSVILHIKYWFEDKNKVIQIDSLNKTIRLSKGGLVRIYHLDDIKYVILVQHPSYSTNPNTSRNSVPWKAYFYIQIEFKNNEKLYLTSLIIKRKDFPIQIHHVRYNSFPLIDNYSYDRFINNEIKISKQVKSDEVDRFKEKFKDYSQNELHEIIDNNKNYEHSAVIAAKELIKNKYVAKTAYD